MLISVPVAGGGGGAVSECKPDSLKRNEDGQAAGVQLTAGLSSSNHTHCDTHSTCLLRGLSVCEGVGWSYLHVFTPCRLGSQGLAGRCTAEGGHSSVGCGSKHVAGILLMVEGWIWAPGDSRPHGGLIYDPSRVWAPMSQPCPGEQIDRRGCVVCISCFIETT